MQHTWGCTHILADTPGEQLPLARQGHGEARPSGDEPHATLGQVGDQLFAAHARAQEMVMG